MKEGLPGPDGSAIQPHPAPVDTTNRPRFATLSSLDGPPLKTARAHCQAYRLTLA
jgi:hypothetical protein